MFCFLLGISNFVGNEKHKSKVINLLLHPQSVVWLVCMSLFFGYKWSFFREMTKHSCFPRCVKRGKQHQKKRLTTSARVLDSGAMTAKIPRLPQMKNSPNYRHFRADLWLLIFYSNHALSSSLELFELSVFFHWSKVCDILSTI